MSIQFIKPGLQSSIQDLGRFGEMHHGIAHSGAMDPLAMKLANWLVSKKLDSATIEITLIGPKLKFHSDRCISICGAQFELFLNETLVFNNQTIKVKKNDILEFRKLQNGARAYLAFSGEVEIEPVKGSLTTNIVSGFGGFHGRAFITDDLLKIRQENLPEIRKLPSKLQPTYSNHVQLRVTEGLERNCFSDVQKNRFYKETFLISAQSNRMGLRLKDQTIQSSSKQQLTSVGVCEGSIQVPPSGHPIISSVEGQTIGGYPRIANVISSDLHLLGQLKAADRVNFACVNLNDAQCTLIKKAELLKELQN